MPSECSSLKWINELTFRNQCMLIAISTSLCEHPHSLTFYKSGSNMLRKGRKLLIFKMVCDTFILGRTSYRNKQQQKINNSFISTFLYVISLNPTEAFMIFTLPKNCKIFLIKFCKIGKL